MIDKQSLSAVKTHIWGFCMQHIYMIDSKGLVTTTRGDELPEHKKIMARRDGTPDMKDLTEIVKHVKPHAVVGLTGGGEAWDQACTPSPFFSNPHFYTGNSIARMHQCK